MKEGNQIQSRFIYLFVVSWLFFFIAYEVTFVCGIWFRFLFSLKTYVLPISSVAVLLHFTFGFVIL